MKPEIKICKYFLLICSAIAVMPLFSAGCGSSAKIPLAEFNFTEFREPPASVRPWVRWWLPGNDIEDAELKREIGLLADNFFGGAEIQPFTAGLNPDASADELARRHSFDTPEYYGHLAAVMDEAKARGIEIDLTLGSGWPSGGMQVKPEESMQTLVWSEKQVKGPEAVTLQLKEPDKPAFYTLADILSIGSEKMTRYMPEYAKLVAVIAARVTGGEREEDILNFTDQIKLEKSSVKILTNLVNENQELKWDVPEGTWQIISFFSMPDGMYPMFNAQSDSGFILNHFDASEVLENLEYFLGDRTNLQKYYGSPLRGFFVDSFEFKAERFFTGDFPAEFQKRRGYDVTSLLPAVLIPGADNNLLDGLSPPRKSAFRFDDLDDRIQYDWKQTASDLFIERFAETAQKWAEEHKMGLRMQAYGLDIDVIRGAGSSSIPEAEQLYAGGADMFLKIVSSGAHLYSRDLVSAETIVWNFLDHMVTPVRIKAAVNKLFSAGINHVVYHGFPYRKPEEYGETGWHPFCSPFGGTSTYSSHICEKDQFFPEMKEINQYAARCQYALRQGKPDTDLLVYYPWFGFPAAFFRLGDFWEPLYNGRLEKDHTIPGMEEQFALMKQFFGSPDMGKKGEWLMNVWKLMNDFHSVGYSWDWVNEHSLMEAEFKEGKINIRGASYKALLVIDPSDMTAELAENIANLAKAGMPFVIAGTHSQLFKTFSEAEVSAVLQQYNVQPGIYYQIQPQPVHHIRRRLAENSQIIFFSNQFRNTVETGFSVTGGCDSPLWLDPWTGDVIKADADQSGNIQLKLDAFDAHILLCGAKSGSAVKESEKGLSVKTKIPVKTWTLDVEADDVPTGHVHLILDDLKDWREMCELKYSGGPGIYHSQVEMPMLEPDSHVILDMGWVEAAAEVYLNGNFAGKSMVPPFEIDVSELIQTGKNDIVIKVKPPLKNRMAGKYLAGEKGYEQFKNKENALAPAGLIGPVVIRIGIIQ